MAFSVNFRHGPPEVEIAEYIPGTAVGIAEVIERSAKLKGAPVPSLSMNSRESSSLGRMLKRLNMKDCPALMLLACTRA